MQAVRSEEAEEIAVRRSRFRVSTRQSDRRIGLACKRGHSVNESVGSVKLLSLSVPLSLLSGSNRVFSVALAGPSQWF